MFLFLHMAEFTTRGDCASVVVFAIHTFMTLTFVETLARLHLSFIAITYIGILILMAYFILQIHRPCLLQNNRPTSLRIITQMYSKFTVIGINIVPSERQGCSLDDMIVLDQFRGPLRKSSGKNIHIYVNICEYILKY